MLPGSGCPGGFALPCGVYLVHHVLLTLVFLRVASRFDLPLTGMFPVYLVVSFALAAVLMAVSGPISKAIKKLA